MRRAKKRTLVGEPFSAVAQTAVRATAKPDGQSTVNALLIAPTRSGWERGPQHLRMLHGTGRNSSWASAAVLRLQRIHGNRYIQRVLDSAENGTATRVESMGMPAGPESSAQRKEVLDSGDSSSTVDTDQLVGLKENDGMTDKTINKRPRVKELQKRLNLKMNANLNLDGKFGPQTLQALNDFQKSQKQQVQNEVDTEVAAALTDGKKPGPTPVFDPDLEDALDNVWLQYQLMFQAQRNMLDRLEKDLVKQEGPSHAVKDFLRTAAIKTLFGLFGAGGEALGGIIVHAIKTTKDEREAIEKSAVEPIVKGLEETAEGAVAGKIEEEVHDRSSEREQLSAFITSQQDGLIEQEGQREGTFLTLVKPEIRKMPHPKGIERAKATAQGIKDGRKAAAQEHYDKAVVAWAQYIAQRQLGGKFVDDEGFTREGTNLRKKGLGARGVLEIEIFHHNHPDIGQPVTIKKATIAGLSEPARQKLTKHKADTKLEDLGLPRVVHGDVGEGLLQGRIEIARNEVGHVFERSNSKGAERWLKLKAKAAGAGGDEPTALSGAKTVFLNEIDIKTVKDLPNGIQGS
jgi:peptidoglycan hydrolase-like protein with peptidoglycan-binding domain